MRYIFTYSRQRREILEKSKKEKFYPNRQIKKNNFFIRNFPFFREFFGFFIFSGLEFFPLPKLPLFHSNFSFNVFASAALLSIEIWGQNGGPFAGKTLEDLRHSRAIAGCRK